MEANAGDGTTRSWTHDAHWLLNADGGEARYRSGENPTRCCHPQIILAAVNDSCPSQTQACQPMRGMMGRGDGAKTSGSRVCFSGTDHVLLESTYLPILTEKAEFSLASPLPRSTLQALLSLYSVLYSISCLPKYTEPELPNTGQ